MLYFKLMSRTHVLADAGAWVFDILRRKNNRPNPSYYNGSNERKPTRFSAEAAPASIPFLTVERGHYVSSFAIYRNTKGEIEEIEI